jgi:hypothetical protein
MVKPLGLLEFLRVSCQLSVRRSGRHKNPAVVDVSGLLRLHNFLGSVVSHQSLVISHQSSAYIYEIGEVGLTPAHLPAPHPEAGNLKPETHSSLEKQS